MATSCDHIHSIACMRWSVLSSNPPACMTEGLSGKRGRVF